MQTLKMIVEYDGTDFSGWQFQNNGRSVQGELEKAAAQLLQEEIRVTGAGRTDAGVHARGQVCHYATASSMETKGIERGLNALLPEDVVVRNVEPAPKEFHSRFSARARKYRYYISKSPTALLRRFRWNIGWPLDMQSLQQCSMAIIGENDFKSFCREQSEVNHHRCIVTKAGWEASGEDLVFEIVANRFLHGMVRTLVGTMVEVGRGHRSVTDFESICKARDRREAGMAAPPTGLFLEAVFYD
jgi:tRNA pseudouridine38-40 synthase